MVILINHGLELCLDLGLGISVRVSLMNLVYAVQLERIRYIYSYSFSAQKRDLSMEIEMIDGMLSEADQQMSTSGKAALIQDWSQLYHMLKQMQRSPPTLLPVSADFTRFACCVILLLVFLFFSEIVPTYTEQTFVLKPYSELRRKADPIYSSPLNVNGLSWRLKVYPVSNSCFSSIYYNIFFSGW